MKTSKKMLLLAVFALVWGLALATTPAPAAWAQNPAPTDCRQVSVGYVNLALITQTWPAGTPGCLALSMTSSGRFDMDYGWAFRAPVTLNSLQLVSYPRSDQTADQLAPFSFPVSAGQVLTFQLEGTADGTELGLDYSLVPPSAREVDQVKLGFNFLAPTNAPAVLQVSKAMWLVSKAAETSCLTVNILRAGTVKVESGWYFGTSIWGVLGSQIISIPSLVDACQMSRQIDAFNVVASAPGDLKVCTTGVDHQEIGLRYRFQ